MILAKVLLVALITAGVEFDVRSTDGTVRSGELEAIAAEVVRLRIDDESIEVPLQNVLKIANRKPVKPAPARRGINIQLVDGTLLTATSIQSTGSEFTIRTRFQQNESQPTDGTISINSQAIRVVQFQYLKDEPLSEWNAIIASEHKGDVIIIRKGQAIDFLEGVILSIGADSISFQFDGDTIDVPQEKLAGLMYYASPADLPAPSTVVSLGNGSRLNASSVTLTKSSVKAITTGGAEIDFPISELQLMDYGSGKVAWLGDTQPASVEVTPRFGSNLSALTRFLYAPRSNKGFDGKPLQLRWPATGKSQSYEHGLALHSRTEMAFRLNRQFKRLKAVVGMSPDVETDATVQLVIRADEEILFDQLIDASAAPFDLELNIEKRRQLKILVDYGDESDIADRINLCDLRVIK